jgi:hypothetical protein
MLCFSLEIILNDRCLVLAEVRNVLERWMIAQTRSMISERTVSTTSPIILIGCLQIIVIKVVTILFLCPLCRPQFLRCSVSKSLMMIWFSHKLCSISLADYHSWRYYHCLELRDQIIISLQWCWVRIFTWCQIISRFTIIISFCILFSWVFRVASTAIRSMVNRGYL